MQLKRKLIEVALPIEHLNRAAQKDKNPFLKGHPRSLHLWWSRKPLAVCRAVLFASLVDDPSAHPEKFPTVAEQDLERKRLLSIMESLIDWQASEGTQAIESAKEEIWKSTGGMPPPIYDPFAGGGSIPLEAKRLGLDAHGADLNPLAVLINKALIELPQKPLSRERLINDVRHYGRWMHKEAEHRLSHLYPQSEDGKVIAWLYCRSVKCPNESCAVDVPLISKFWLSTKPGKQAYINPVVEREKGRSRIRFDIVVGEPEKSHLARLKTGTRVIHEGGKVAKGAFRCLACDTGVVKGNYIHSESEAGRLGIVPLASVVETERGRKYLPLPNAVMEESFQKTDQSLSDYRKLHAVLEQPSRGTFASNAQGRSYGLRSFSDYFLPRQLFVLCALTDLVKEVHEQISSEENSQHADAVATYLAFAVNHLVRYSTLLNPWNTTNQNVAQIFGRQAMQMTWDFAEANILNGPLNMITTSEWVAMALQCLPNGDSSASITHLDSTVAVTEVKDPLIVTDPPYYNYISYADLSDFFYVWLHRSLAGIYPELFKDELVSKDRELVVTPHRFDSDDNKARQHFLRGLTSSFKQMHSQAHSNYPLSVFYAFNPKDLQSSIDFVGWELMIEALIESGWMITAAWSLSTERSTRMVARGSKALPSSLMLVLRKRSDAAKPISEIELQNEIKDKLPEIIARLNRDHQERIVVLQLALVEAAKILSTYASVVGENGLRVSCTHVISIISRYVAAACGCEQ